VLPDGDPPVAAGQAQLPAAGSQSPGRATSALEPGGLRVAGAREAAALMPRRVPGFVAWARFAAWSREVELQRRQWLDSACQPASSGGRRHQAGQDARFFGRRRRAAPRLAKILKRLGRPSPGSSLSRQRRLGRGPVQILQAAWRGRGGGECGRHGPSLSSCCRQRRQ